jgi:acetoin:2,6-dichlorophenolindophenol oxidoreductase subunit alpha
VAEMRAGGGPRFLWCKTYRFSGHVSVDPAAYREQSDLDAAMQRDPLLVTRQHLMSLGMTAAAVDAIDADATAAVERAQDLARNAAPPLPATAFHDVQDADMPFAGVSL